MYAFCDFPLTCTSAASKAGGFCPRAAAVKPLARTKLRNLRLILPPIRSVLRWLFDLVDHHYVHLRSGLLDMQPELLFHGGINIRRGIRVRRWRRSTRSRAEWTHAGIGRELQNEAVARIAQAGLVHHWLVHELSLQHAGKLNHRRVVDIKAALRHAAEAGSRNRRVR